MSKKLTPWFKATTQKPVRVGWYDFYDGLWGKHIRVMWNGKYWVLDNGNRITLYSCDKWRGIMRDN